MKFLLLTALLFVSCGPGSFYQRTWAAYYKEHGTCEKLCKLGWNARVDHAKRIDSTTCECTHNWDPIERLMIWKPDRYATCTCSRSCDNWENKRETDLLGRQTLQCEVDREFPPWR